MSAKATLAVARKEFLENVLSWKFLIALVLSVLLVGTSVFVLASAHRDDQEAYTVRLAQMERMDNDWSDMQRRVYEVLARPNALAVFFGGPGDEMRREQAGARDPFGASADAPRSGSGSPVAARFSPLDLGFVAVVVMTFTAVVYAYDSVSGERERGTLKLMLANPVPKDSVLLGKYLGGMASLLLPFGVAVLLGLAVAPAAGLRLASEEVAALGVVLLAAVLLVSVFYLVGLLVSSLSRRSTTSLVALALVWLVLVFGVGNVAALAAEATVPVLSGAEVRERFAEIDQEAFARSSEVMGSDGWSFQVDANGSARPDPAAEERQRRLAEIQAEAQARRDALTEAARRAQDNRLERAEAVALVSPAEVFRSLATHLVGSDYWSHKHAQEASTVYLRETEEARRAWAEEQHGGGPIFRAVRIGPGGVVQPQGERFQPPEFPYEAPSLQERLSSARAARDLVALVAANVLAFLGAYAAFLRYDVR